MRATLQHNGRKNKAILSETSRHARRAKAMPSIENACASAMERLEERLLMSNSPIMVLNNNDNGADSLRAAIITANSQPGPDEIDFNISGSKVITLQQPLPHITQELKIIGGSNNGVPLIGINGIGLHGFESGLTIGAKATISGLAIYNFTHGAGITFGIGSDNSSLTGNYVGIDNSGTAAVDDTKDADGIDIKGSSGVTIGGNTAGDRNVISANGLDGIRIDNSALCTIVGNYIGTNVAGTAAMANGQDGIEVTDSSTITIGGVDRTWGNLITGNRSNGIEITASSHVVVQANLIGTDATGLNKVVTPSDDPDVVLIGNLGDGILVDGDPGEMVDSTNTTIGGNSAGAANVISGNTANGVEIYTLGSENNLIKGNFVGTDVGGQNPLGNNASGIRVGKVGLPVDNGIAEISGNVIGGNADGVYLTDGAYVHGNLIGTNVNGATGLGNLSDGVYIASSGSSVSSNTIADNLWNGVYVNTGTSNTIRKNAIYANGFIGIDLESGNAPDDGSPRTMLSSEGFVTPNDPAEHDSGPNLLQNFPVFTDVATSAGSVTFSGTLDSMANGPFTIDFYANASGESQGRQYIGSTSVSTDSLGHGTFLVTLTLSSPLPANTNFTSTATDSVGNTSEFSLSATAASVAASTTSLSSSLNPSRFGQSVTFLATVTGGTPSAGDFVTFMDGSTTLAANVPLTGNAASFTIASLGAGDHSITAVYSGNSSLAGSTSNALHQYVNAATTNTTLSSSFDPSNVGDSVTFTANVSSVAGGPTGTVTFMDSSDVLGTAALVGGIATLDVATFSIGTHVITAVYGGTPNYLASTSAALSQVVNTTTTTSLTSATNPSLFNQSVMLTATVTAASNDLVSGVVTFMDGSTVLGSATLVGGQASLDVSSLSIGSHTITAVYGGAGNFLGSTSNSISQVVNTATTTTLTSSANPSLSGATVTLTANVTAASLDQVNGSVTFMDGPSVLGTVALTGGVAHLDVSTFGLGTHPLTAVYAASGNFLASTSSPLSQVVNASTITTLTSSTNPSTFGQAVTITATVTAPAGGTPTGSVTLMDGSVSLGTFVLSNGQASFTSSALTVGGHVITASFSGTNNFVDSAAAPITQNVSKVGTTTALGSSLNPSTFGQLVTFTATVSASTGGTPSGTIEFMDGSTSLGTVTLTNGQASFAASALAVGSHTITARYTASGNFLDSNSTPLTQTVAKAATTTALTSSHDPSSWGQSITLTATVSAGSAASGTVTFTDGAVSLGTVPVINGAASFTTSTLSVASHPIVATYSGDGNYTASSDSLTQVVNVAGTTTTLSSSLNPTVFGQSVTLTAKVNVAAPGAGTPTGVVTFTDGSTVLGTGTLSAGGVATFSTSSLTVVTHSITATYSGDTDFAGSSDALQQAVNDDATTTTLTSSVNPSIFGQSVKFTASVVVTAPGAGTPTGTIKFMDGAAEIGSGTLDASGLATFTTSSLAVSSHVITAVYSGDATDNPNTSAVLTQVVEKATSTIMVGSSLNPSGFGQSVTFTATVLAAGSPTGTVSFFEGTTLLGTSVVNAGGVATFTTASLSAASHTITATYGGDASFEGSTGAVAQVVNQAATTTVLSSSLNPSSFGQSVTFTVTIGGPTPTAGDFVTFLEGATTLAANVPLSGNTASFTITSLGAGSHSITAIYSGNNNVAGSTSDALSQLVNAAVTATTLSSSLDPSNVGDSVTFTANVSSAAAGLTGSVVFMDGSSTLATVALANGIASYSSSALVAGHHNITAVYSGNANFQTSTSPVVDQEVDKLTTATSITSSLNPSTVGQSVTFTATVTGSSGSPSGTVVFTVDGVAMSPVAVDADGKASFSSSALGIGSHNISAAYGGSNAYSISASADLPQSVIKITTTTTITSSVNPSVFGQSVTLTAMIVGALGSPTGTVTFMEGGNTLGTGTLAGGVASLSTSALSVGVHSITAVYSGDANDSGSTSVALNQNVAKAAAVVTVTPSVNPSVFGQSVTFTANVGVVAPGAGLLTGTINFMDGANSLGVVTLTGGTATLSTSSLSVSGHAIVAVYSGDANFAAASGSLAQVVNSDATTTTLSASVNPSLFGQAVTFTATVAVAAPGSGLPTGMVTFKDGSITLGIATLDSTGAGSYTTNLLSVGIHSITAVYGGDANDNSSTSSPLTQTVSPAATTTSVISSVNPAAFGQSVTFTTTVANGVGGSPTGTVKFYDGATLLGTGTLNAGGVATFSSTSLSVASHTINAVYSGDSSFNGSTGSLTQAVNPATTSTTLASSVNPSVFGQSVTFTATVSGASPTGTVTFMDGTTPLGTGALSGGVATFATSALSVDSHAITAVYGGDSNDAASTSVVLSQNVAKAATGVIISSSVNPAVFGQSITFTANVAVVAPGVGTLTGSITFMDGATNLGTVTLAGGTASLSISALTVGSHTITAAYSGDTHFAGSTAAKAQAVNNDSTTTTLSSSVNPSVFGQSVTFSATVVVTTPGAGVPTGTVTFMDGAAALGTGTLNGGGVATFSSSTLSVSTHSITAVYGGDGNDNTNTSAALSQVVNKDSTSTTLASSLNPAVYGQSVTFTSNVSVLAPGAGIATGTVNFMDGATVLGTGTLTGGVATFSTSGLSVASHNITAVYSGDAKDATSTSAALALAVNQAATSTGVVTSANPATLGQTVTFTATVSVLAPGAGVRTGTVTFKDGATVLGTGTVNASGVATFSTSALASGSHTITAAYSGDANFSTSSGSLTQTVNASLASISGHVYTDTTGNGLTADDTLLPGVTVMLFKDLNNSGVLDSSDGSAIATQVSASNGMYSFSNLAAGNYIVEQVTPTGYVRTAPALSDYYAVGATAGSSTTNKDFDEYQTECVLSNFYNIYYVIDGTTTVTTLGGNTQPGDEVTVYFTAKANVSDTLSLVAYTAPDAYFNANDASQQVIYTLTTKTVNTGSQPATFNMTVQIPISDYQIDFICGPAIDKLGPAGSNIFYHPQNRIFDSDNDGNGIVATNVSSSVAGIAYCDDNLNGKLDGSDMTLPGAKITLTDSTGHVVGTTTSGANGSYSFTGVAAGNYTVKVSTPAAGHLAGPVNSGPINVTVSAGVNSTVNNFAEIAPGNFSGFAFADENNDGKIDFHEAGIVNVTIKLTGTDCFNNTVSMTTITDGDGQYIFSNVNPGVYKISETQPTNTVFTEGKVAVGSLGGTVLGQDAINAISLPGCGEVGINYNFGELGTCIVHGATATIGFWHNTNGQALLKSLNGGPNSVAMGNWLAGQFNMYSMFAGRTNSYIANFYNTNDFAASGVKLDAQVLAAAFASYVTNSTWAGGTYATAYGFNVNSYGSGYETVNVGSNGAAFGVANNSNITILQALAATDAMTSGSTLYGGNTTLRNQANTTYTLINQGGDIT